VDWVAWVAALELVAASRADAQTPTTIPPLHCQR